MKAREKPIQLSSYHTPGLNNNKLTCKFTALGSCTVEPVTPSTHLSYLHTFNFFIQLKSLQGLIATIVGYVIAVPFF